MDTDEFRDIGHNMIDMIADYLEHIEDQALFPEVTPRHLDELFNEPLPQEPTEAQDVIRQIQEKLLPFDQIHREVARRIEKGGRFWISTTVLKGQSYFRINPVNFRTRAAHMEALLEEIMRECASVCSSIG